jgi:hypothetical protein
MNKLTKTHHHNEIFVLIVALKMNKMKFLFLFLVVVLFLGASDARFARLSTLSDFQRGKLAASPVDVDGILNEMVGFATTKLNDLALNDCKWGDGDDDNDRNRLRHVRFHFNMPIIALKDIDDAFQSIVPVDNSISVTTTTKSPGGLTAEGECLFVVPEGRQCVWVLFTFNVEPSSPLQGDYNKDIFHDIRAAGTDIQKRRKVRTFLRCNTHHYKLEIEDCVVRAPEVSQQTSFQSLYDLDESTGALSMAADRCQREASKRREPVFMGCI